MKNMTTKVRTVDQGYCNGSPYKHFYIDILTNRYSGQKNFKSLEPMGTICLQSGKGTNEEWYNISYKIETDNPDYIVKMAKLAKFIKENAAWGIQPQGLLLLIGAQEYFRHESDFIPVTDKGKRFYRVMKGTQYQRNIIAANDIIANKIAKLGDGEELVFAHIIE